MNLVQSIQSTLYERIVSPLAGIFILSWTVMHYDLVMMLMSKHDMIYKTQIVHEYMVIDAKNNWTHTYFVSLAPFWFGLLKPLIFSFFTLVTYSIISIPAFKISSEAKFRLLAIRRAYEQETPIEAGKHLEIVDIYKAKIQRFNEDSFKAEKDLENSRGLYQEAIKEREALKKQINSMISKRAETSENDDEKSEALIAARKLRDGGLELDVGQSFSGSYVDLLFNSEHAYFNRKMLKMSSQDNFFTPEELLLSINKPLIQSNVDLIVRALGELERYHLVRDLHNKFELTDSGIHIRKLLIEDESLAKVYCQNMDDSDGGVDFDYGGDPI